MPKVDLEALPVLGGSGYLPPYQAAVAGRSRRAVADNLAAFGANLVRLEPGAWSSQRHWHSAEDELVIMVSGEAVLIEDGGETLLRPGDIATFARGVANGHHLINRTDRDVVFLAVGNDAPDTDECHYPDIDMFWSGTTGFVRKSGAPD
jgi:uncharacterized cupin superfamily protein